ncbi:MAG: PQQ-binding-like beta-propeller repeat protein, partial [Gemmatimonadota bacterium]|nr:PQQ-binding-like beta-propeller repeat protein [Gemmatimonadota bacterium]
PPSVEGTIVNPGWAGGGNWNGAAFDPETQYLYIPSYTDYTVVELRKTDTGESDDFDYIWGGAQTPTVDGLPIFKPPWGRVTAIDMSTGDHVWQVANGRGPRDHPALAGLDLGYLGRGLGSGESFPLLTSTLLFTTVDGRGSEPPRLYAYDKATGDMVWEFELPAGVHANPMTYMYQGRQYLAVSVGRGRTGEGIVALALGNSGR